MVGGFRPGNEVGLFSWVLLDVRHITPCQLEANSSLMTSRVFKWVSVNCVFNLPYSMLQYALAFLGCLNVLCCCNRRSSF